jgi:hypothetical protein
MTGMTGSPIFAVHARARNTVDIGQPVIPVMAAGLTYQTTPLQRFAKQPDFESCRIRMSGNRTRTYIAFPQRLRAATRSSKRQGTIFNDFLRGCETAWNGTSVRTPLRGFYAD